MAELQPQPNQPDKQAHMPISPEVVESTRSRVSGLEHVEMTDKERALFDESKVLQNRIASDLAKVDKSSKPEITPEMRRVVEIAFELSGRPNKGDLPLSAGLIGIHGSEKPIFMVGGWSFDYDPTSDRANEGEDWPHAFSYMIDIIDPDNNKRFVS